MLRRGYGKFLLLQLYLVSETPAGHIRFTICLSGVFALKTSLCMRTSAKPRCITDAPGLREAVYGLQFMVYGFVPAFFSLHY